MNWAAARETFASFGWFLLLAFGGAAYFAIGFGIVYLVTLLGLPPIVVAPPAFLFLLVWLAGFAALIAGTSE